MKLITAFLFLCLFDSNQAIANPLVFPNESSWNLLGLSLIIVMALIVTLIIEIPIFRYVFKQKQILDCVLINIITNPVANVLFIILITSFSFYEFQLVSVVLAIELSVIISEYLMYKRMQISRPLIISVSLNICSFLIGIGANAILFILLAHASLPSIP